MAARCRLVAVAMDKRAGAYLKGGEATAREARATIPKEALEECKAVAAKAREGQRAAAPQRISINPQVSQQKTAAPQVRLAVQQPAKVRLDLPAPQRIRLDLKAPERIAINPKPLAQAQQVRLNLAQGNSR